MPWPEFFQTYSLVLAAILFGAFVARATGVGFALLLVSALLALPHLDQPTVLFLVAPLSIMNLGLISAMLYRATPLQEMRVLAVPVLTGVLLGITLGILVSKTWILMFGLIVVGYNIWTMAHPASVGKTSVMALPWVGGGLTGLMTGSLSFPGPPISAYMLARSYIGDSVRMTVALTAIGASIIRLILGGPFITWLPEFWQVLQCGALLIVIGTILGLLAAQSMKPKTHRMLILALTMVTFLLLIWGLVTELQHD